MKFKKTREEKLAENYVELHYRTMDAEAQEVVDAYGRYGFVRTTKSMAVNIGKVKSITSDINARIRLQLCNEEEIIMNRAYKKAFHQKLGEYCKKAGKIE